MLTQQRDSTEEQTRDYQQNKNHPGLITKKCGLVVSMENPRLGVSPDRVIHNSNSTSLNCLVEYKTPFSLRELTIEQSHMTKKWFCLKIV